MLAALTDALKHKENSADSMLCEIAAIHQYVQADPKDGIYSTLRRGRETKVTANPWKPITMMCGHGEVH
jgi:hypothetical protein